MSNSPNYYCLHYCRNFRIQQTWRSIGWNFEGSKEVGINWTGIKTATRVVGSWLQERKYTSHIFPRGGILRLENVKKASQVKTWCQLECLSELVCWAFLNFQQQGGIYVKNPPVLGYRYFLESPNIPITCLIFFCCCEWPQKCMCTKMLIDH